MLRVRAPQRPLNLAFMRISVEAEEVDIPTEAARRPWALLTCIRFREILLLQGPPWMGIVLSTESLDLGKIPAIALFAAASFLLVAHIWSLNDWADERSDRFNPHKAGRTFASKGVSPRQMLTLSLGLLAASLGLFALLSTRTLLIAGAIAFLGTLYSLSNVDGKGTPVLSSVLHFVGGFLHFLLGYCLFSSLDRHAFLLAPIFALIFAAGHAIQEVQDWEFDSLSGIQTNAVQFGQVPVFLAALVGFSLAYGYLFSLAITNLIPHQLNLLLLVLFPLHLFWSLRTLKAGLTFERLRRLRNRYRALFALIGIGLVSAHFL
jgi:4-hydroxybenzoate polyprenyltransferase